MGIPKCLKDNRRIETNICSAVQMMAEDPPWSPCRWWSQTTLRCCRQKLWCWAL